MSKMMSVELPETISAFALYPIEAYPLRRLPGRILHNPKGLRQLPGKLTVEVTEKFPAGHIDFWFFPQLLLHFPLDGDMGNTFHLKIAFGRFGIIFFLHGANDVVRVRVMTLAQIGIVAIYDSEQFPKRVERHRMLPGAELGGFLDHLQGVVLKFIRLFGQEWRHAMNLRVHVLAFNCRYICRF
ncbi:MAG: hypothetical protein M0009_16375 [Deltaproteobacteria bacterium]|nr:hypothetical protein [Deltaproteobacteria bacterium]